MVEYMIACLIIFVSLCNILVNCFLLIDLRKLVKRSLPVYCGVDPGIKKNSIFSDKKNGTIKDEPRRQIKTFSDEELWERERKLKHSL